MTDETNCERARKDFNQSAGEHLEHECHYPLGFAVGWQMGYRALRETVSTTLLDLADLEARTRHTAPAIADELRDIRWVLRDAKTDR